MAKRWWVKPAFALSTWSPSIPTNPLAIRTLVEDVKKGRKIVIFPEGRITVTGTLMKVYEGPGAIAQMADAKVLPVRIDGAQFSHLLAHARQAAPALVSQDHHHLPAAGEIRSARRPARLRLREHQADSSMT